jgi:hypothetical protein
MCDRGILPRWRFFAVVGAITASTSGQTQPGLAAQYRLENPAAPRGSVVSTFTLALGPLEKGQQWISLAASKGNGEEFRIWLLSAGPPTHTHTLRYLFQGGGSSRLREYRNQLTNEAALPSQGDWDLLPQPIAGLPKAVRYLGHRYTREALRPDVPVSPPADAEVVGLRPDLLLGPASNTRQKDETRRYDGSDYQLVRLTREDYRQMRDAGINCVAVDAEQWKWADELGLYYWGAGSGLPFPESLYRSQYLGPALFLDEPAVGTRDYVVRPRLAKDQAFRKAITPQLMFEEFRKYYEHALREASPSTLMKGLRARTDLDLGDMDLRQENLYTWETMVSTAAYQLSQDPRVPEAIVFEPRGRIGTRRTLPEMDMTYGVQLPPEDPKALADIIFGFLRGAARLTAKKWGISIYGAFERADAPWWMTYAYDLGATRFFFWDNSQLACVPFGEVLALARHLRDYSKTHPRPEPGQLRSAAEVAIVLPPGYDLGHVQTGKGNMWGVGELNLERLNRQGIAYRVVMSNFFTEIERCFKRGVPFDLLWDLPGMKLTGYREIVRIREDGKVEVNNKGDLTILDRARAPERADGTPPQLAVTLSSRSEAEAVKITARARVEETSAKVYYTFGADDEGVYRNAMVAWEIYGPEEQDQLVLIPNKLKPSVVQDSTGGTVEVSFKLASPGNYRLRAATVDVTGRTSVVWQPIAVSRESAGGKLAVR